MSRCSPVPATAVSPSLLEHPPPELDDLTASFREGYQHYRRDQPETRVPPAQQGLHAGELPVCGRDDRLIGKLQLPTSCRSGQRALQFGELLGSVHII